MLFVNSFFASRQLLFVVQCADMGPSSPKNWPQKLRRVFNLGIVALLRLEKTSEIIKSNRQPIFRQPFYIINNFLGKDFKKCAKLQIEFAYSVSVTAEQTPENHNPDMLPFHNTRCL